jgi:hypothetical protein
MYWNIQTAECIEPSTCDALAAASEGGDSSDGSKPAMNLVINQDNLKEKAEAVEQEAVLAAETPPEGFEYVGPGNCLANDEELNQWYACCPISFQACADQCANVDACIGYDSDGNTCRLRFAADNFEPPDESNADYGSSGGNYDYENYGENEDGEFHAGIRVNTGWFITGSTDTDQEPSGFEGRRVGPARACYARSPTHALLRTLSYTRSPTHALLHTLSYTRSPTHALLPLSPSTLSPHSLSLPLHSLSLLLPQH